MYPRSSLHTLWSRSVSRSLFLAFIALLAALLPLAQPAGVQAGPAPMAGPEMATLMGTIDTYVERERQAARIPGIALAIVQGDQVVHLQGFGEADPSGRAVTAQTPFVIGSASKSFTAVAIMQLVEAGKVELDAPVQRYLPWFRVADAAASARITVRHLLTHSSGLPGGDETPIISREDTSADAIERQVRALATVELAHPPGSTVEYSSKGYTTLGLIVETVSGQSYEAYVRQHIFTPLQMDHSFTSPEEARGFGLAEGHQFWFGQPRQARLPFPRGVLPAGYLVSSAEDMSRYLLAHLNGGRVGEARILSPAGVAELHRPAMSAGDGISIGMDWGVADVDGVRLLQHDGNTNNYRSEVYFAPEAGWGFVLLMNASNALQRSATSGIGRGVTTLLLGQQPQAVAWNRQSDMVIGTLLVIAALQVLNIVLSIRKLRHWRAAPPRRAVWRQIVLPLAGNALVGVLLLVGLPTVLRTLLSALIFQIPDLGYTLAIAGTLALGWSLLRTVLAFRVLPRRSPASGRTTLQHA